MITVFLRQVAPEIVLVAAAALVLVADLCTSKRRPVLSALIGLSGIVLSLITAKCGCCVLSAHPGTMISMDPFALFFRVLFSCASGLALLFSLGSRELPDERFAEYTALILVFTAGMTLMAASSNFLLLYVSMELVSLIAYAITAFNPTHPRSSEAGLKYSIYGAVASGLMLFGISIIFGSFGTLEYCVMGKLFAEGMSPLAGPVLLMIGLFLFMGGLFFKIAAVPFQAWCPDAYEGAPTPFTALMSVAPKAAGFAALARFFFLALTAGKSGILMNIPWVEIAGVISALTMTFGNLAALTQTSVKRMLAYSSIAHAGYMLMALVTLTGNGLAALCAYLVVYLIMNMGAFLGVLAVSESTGGENFEDWRGIGRKAPLIGVCMTIFLLSLTGIPPMAGFVGKFYLFAAVVAHGGYWYWILAVIGVLNSVVSLFYYFRVVKAMYMMDPPDGLQTVNVDAGRKLLLGILAALTVLIGIYWTPLSRIAGSASVIIFP